MVRGKFVVIDDLVEIACTCAFEVCVEGLKKNCAFYNNDNLIILDKLDISRWSLFVHLIYF